MAQLGRLAMLGGAALLVIATVSRPALAQTVTARRETAVAQARAGQADAAIAALRAMLAAGQEEGLVAMDLTALLQQAGAPADAIAVFEKAGLAEPPDYAL